MLAVRTRSIDDSFVCKVANTADEATELRARKKKKGSEKILARKSIIRELRMKRERAH